jgi:hypothetical protein
LAEGNAGKKRVIFPLGTKTRPWSVKKVDNFFLLRQSGPAGPDREGMKRGMREEIMGIHIIHRSSFFHHPFLFRTKS